MSMHRGCLPWQKLTQKITDSGRFALRFCGPWGRHQARRATYLCLDCAKSVDKNWNIIVSFIIHMNFDHAWAEHYPVTLIVLVLLLDGRDWLLQSGADAEVYVGVYCGVVNLMVKKVNLGIGSQSYRISFKNSA